MGNSIIPYAGGLCLFYGLKYCFFNVQHIIRCGKFESFIYKNQEIRDYINNSKQEPTIGKRTYTDLEEANKRIKELEIENMILRMKNVGLFKRATNLYTRMANLTELNIRNMEEEMEDDEAE